MCIPYPLYIYTVTEYFFKILNKFIITRNVYSVFIRCMILFVYNNAQYCLK